MHNPAIEQRMALSQKRRAQVEAVRSLPAETTDGLAVSVMVNAGLAEDAASLDLTGADGIGLFRTEFQFLVSATLPGRDSQLRLYRKVLGAVRGKPVVFRTLDIGGDKALPYLVDGKEEAENPSMGWRALRLSLDRSTLMKAQARALIQAADRKVLRVMFPMISEPWEYEQARALFEEQVTWAKRGKRGHPSSIEFGAMLEVPALAEVLDQLLPRIDFLSIGTNDLTQFLFAADRADPRLAERYDWLSPAILRFLKRVIVQARAGLRGDERPPARVHGADRYRRREFLDHSGGGGADQGDGALARRVGDPGADGPGAGQATERHSQVALRLGPPTQGGDRLNAERWAVDSPPSAFDNTAAAQKGE